MQIRITEAIVPGEKEAYEVRVEFRDSGDNVFDSFSESCDWLDSARPNLQAQHDLRREVVDKVFRDAKKHMLDHLGTSDEEQAEAFWVERFRHENRRAPTDEELEAARAKGADKTTLAWRAPHNAKKEEEKEEAASK